MFVHNYLTAKLRNYRDFIAIHRTPHHVDDVMAAAIAMHYTPGTEYKVVVIKRTKEEIDFCKKNAKMILDVGMETGEAVNQFGYTQYRFDHHQYDDENHPRYENGIKMAATGLVLEHYYKEGKFVKEVYDYLLEHLIYGIDANDNGQTSDYRNKLMFVSDYNKMSFETETEYLQNLESMITFAKKLFERNLEIANCVIADKEYIMDKIQDAVSKDMKYIYLDRFYEVASELVREHNNSSEKKILFIVHESYDDDEFVISTVRKNPLEFEAYKQLPEQWAGKSGEELAEITGFKSAIFCHRGRFVAKFGDKEDVMNAVEYCVKNE